jgi:repressor LexA
VLQKAAAGQRIVAGEDVRDYLPLPAWYVRSDQVFAFEVEGDSMTGEDGVLHGDLVIVDRDPTWVNGDMVVVSVGDHEREVVVRRLWRDGDSFRLQSSNPAYEAAILRVEDDPIVLGKVIGVARWHIKRGRRHAEPPH